MKSSVIIVGTGSLAQLGLEILQKNDIIVYGFLAEEDSKYTTQIINDIPILGSLHDISNLIETFKKNAALFIAIENTAIRQQYIKKLTAQPETTFINLIHPSANFAASTTIGIGNVIGAGACISSTVHIDNHCIIHAHAILEYGVHIKDFAQISSGSIIGEHTVIEENVFIGSGATIIAGLHIGAGARIGAGSVVLESVKSKEVLLGNPAKPVKLT